MTSSVAVSEAGKINAYDKFVIKKEKIWKLKKFIHKSPPKGRFWNGIYSLPLRADVRGSADASYCM